ncbi:Hypp5958 [Branchiostoma lanceolatum]|uniref:Hypp5958 protein n=1 Tax=Branchiostoma lanceolatum TaxID=7740 RepID=A0A8J9YPM1_BRALA|nr:Hypp5958 [Branchiostoma lanceolatum]
MAAKQPVTILVPFCYRAVDYSSTENLLRTCEGIPVGKVIFSYIEEGQSLLDYFYRLKEVVTDNNVGVVLALYDSATLVQSALVREFPNRLEGPSVESSFLAYHKVYTSQCLDPDIDPSPHGVLDLDSKTLLEDAATLLKKMELPAFAKVPCGDASQGVWKISTTSQLTDILEATGRINDEHYSQNEHICSATFMRDFFQKVLDVDHYPMVLRNTIIVEPYIDAPAKVCVDGCVYNKEIIHWAISDSLHWPGQDISFQGSCMPSTLPDMIQTRLWGGFDKVVGRMVDHGFNNQFVHVEYFILANGQIKLIEVNARMSGNLSGLYTACLSGPLPLKTYLGLCCGVRPNPPVPTGRAALNLPLQVHENYTGKAGDMVNLSVVENLREDLEVKITWVMAFDEEFLPGKAEFAKLWAYGKTPDDAKKKCREAVQRLVKKPEQLKFKLL